jgi:hypothetical protein
LFTEGTKPFGDLHNYTSNFTEWPPGIVPVTDPFG